MEPELLTWPLLGTREITKLLDSLSSKIDTIWSLYLLERSSFSPAKVISFSPSWWMEEEMMEGRREVVWMTASIFEEKKRREESFFRRVRRRSLTAWRMEG